MRQFLCSPAREEASQQENILSVLTYIGHLYFDGNLECYFILPKILLLLVDKVILNVKAIKIAGQQRGLMWCGVLWCVHCIVSVMNNIPTSPERPFINFFYDSTESVT